MSKVAVQLLSWNGEKQLGRVLGSLAGQTFADFELLVLDNASDDGSVAVVEDALKNFPRPARFIKSDTNLGFSGGHNALFAASRAPYILCVNQDTEPDPLYLETLAVFMDAHPQAGAVSGKLLRQDTGAPTIDSAGLRLRWFGAVADIGAKEQDVGQYDQAREVFGVSGALALYRRAAVIDASVDGSMFDPAYFAYKEDVDLAWRLKLRNWQAYALGSAVAYHARSMGVGREREGWRQKNSVRNHLLTLIKCLPSAAWPRLPLIAGYELAKAAYLLATAPKTLTAYAEVLRLLPYIMKNRKVIQSRRVKS